MTTIYLKSQDERTVTSLRGKNPQVPKFLIDEGYSQIDQKEFRKLLRKIRNKTNAVKK